MVVGLGEKGHRLDPAEILRSAGPTFGFSSDISFSGVNVKARNSKLSEITTTLGSGDSRLTTIVIRPMYLQLFKNVDRVVDVADRPHLRRCRLADTAFSVETVDCVDIGPWSIKPGLPDVPRPFSARMKTRRCSLVEERNSGTCEPGPEAADRYRHDGGVEKIRVNVEREGVSRSRERSGETHWPLIT